MIDELAVILAEVLPVGWEHNAGTYGMDFTLVCPCGVEIEQDGVCPDGHESPLIGLGLI